MLGLAAALSFGLMALSASATASTRSASDSTAANGAIASAKARCPDGQRATGGGFKATPPTGSLWYRVFESRKVRQRSWRVSAEQEGDGALALTSFVYCSADAPKTKAKSHPVTVPPSILTGTADASCDSGKAQAGGVTAGSFFDVGLLDLFRASNKTWRARAYNDPGELTITSYAYCATGGPPKARPGIGAVVSGSQVPATTLSRKCENGTSIVAGGFEQPDADPSTTTIFDLPWESFRKQDRWRVSAIHLGLSSSTLISIAYCA